MKQPYLLQGEAKEVAQATSEAFARSLAELENLTSETGHYPFQEKLDRAIATLKEVNGKPYAWYLTELLDREDDLLDLKEDILDPISKFMKGSQREIFDRSYSYLREQEANFAYIEGDEVEQIRAILENEQCFKGGLMQQTKTLLETLQQKVSEQIELEKKLAQQKIDELQNGLIDHPEYSVLSSEQQTAISNPFIGLTNKVETQNTIAVIRDTLRSFKENEYNPLLKKIDSWADPTKEIEYVSIQSILQDLDETFLSELSEVEQYLDSLGEALRREIENGKRISI